MLIGVFFIPNTVQYRPFVSTAAPTVLCLARMVGAGGLESVIKLGP